MIEKILTCLFGNKLIEVHAYDLYGHARWEQYFVFNRNATEKEIRDTLWNVGEGMVVITSEKMRTKKHKEPESGYYKPVSELVCVTTYD